MPQARRAFAFTDWGDQLVALRDGSCKYVLDFGSGRELLFDLATDPGEQVDLTGARREWADACKAAALAWIARTRATVQAW